MVIVEASDPVVCDVSSGISGMTIQKRSRCQERIWVRLAGTGASLAGLLIGG
jgi:hypothetical protein